MNISDQYLVLDNFRANPFSDIANGQYKFDLAIHGVTTDTTIGVVDRMDNIVEMEVEPFYFPYDFNFTEINQVMPTNIPHYRGAVDNVPDPDPDTITAQAPFNPANGSVVVDSGSLANIVSTNKTQLSQGVRSNISKLTNLIGSTNLEYIYADAPGAAYTVTAIGLLGSVTMQIQETGNQSVSDYQNRRHHFNFKSALETVVRTVTSKTTPTLALIVDYQYTADNTLVTTGGLAPSLNGSVPNLDNPTIAKNITALPNTNTYFGDGAISVQEISEKFYYLTPTKSMYIFTDPINSFQEITVVFKNIDRLISFKPCVYENVPMVFLQSAAIESLNLLGVTTAGANSYMAFIVPNHGLIAGDCITINETLAVVMGSYDMEASARSSMGAQSANNVIVINPLISVPTAGDVINTVYVKIYVHKRRIRIPMRFRKAVNRRTNNIISTS